MDIKFSKKSIFAIGKVSEGYSVTSFTKDCELSLKGGLYNEMLL